MGSRFGASHLYALQRPPSLRRRARNAAKQPHESEDGRERGYVDDQLQSGRPGGVANQGVQHFAEDAAIGDDVRRVPESSG